MNKQLEINFCYDDQCSKKHMDYDEVDIMLEAILDRFKASHSAKTSAEFQEWLNK